MCNLHMLCTIKIQIHLQHKTDVTGSGVYIHEQLTEFSATCLQSHNYVEFLTQLLLQEELLPP